RLEIGKMFLIISLVTGLALSASGVMTDKETDPRQESLHEIQKQVNDLWQNLLYPITRGNETDGMIYTTSIFYLDGFPLDNNQSSRAIHIHELGDLSNGCDSTGGHYNPFRVNHPRHPGDFGNFLPKEGKIRKYKTNLFATVFGPYSIMGRSVVIHEQEDDMGKGNNKASLENGNAGKRLACCVIGITNKNLWEEKLPEVMDKKKRGLKRTYNQA
ncbi:SODE dismutase, partial [Horornis vulcanius]|nr:SODE dismutase [Horornis vulcanius]